MMIPGRPTERELDRQMSGAASRRPARICMPTTRKFSRKVFECGLYEAEDVLCDVDDVDLIGLEATPGFRVRERWVNRVIFRDVSHRAHRLNPGLRPKRLDRDYDLFVAFCPSYEELLYVNAIENWKDRCRVSACWIDEIWTASLEKYRHWLPMFKQFDHILVTHQETASALSAALGRPVTWLPAAVDTLRFTPYASSAPTSRSVDVYSIGRRREGIHDALLRRARTTPFYYVYDTYRASVADVYDVTAHRDLLANTAKRSRYFVVAPPKFDSQHETAGQVEVGYRYFEGAAAGCVLIGERADSAAFRQLFPWDDAVIDLATDGSDVAKVLSALAGEPERLSAMAHRNAANSLLSHDWAYRWRALVELAGLPASDKMGAREARLGECAAAASGESPTPQLWSTSTTLADVSRTAAMAATSHPSQDDNELRQETPRLRSASVSG